MISLLPVKTEKHWNMKSSRWSKEFLAVRGLTLSEEKTKITHIDDGFDFLGFNIRKYKGNLTHYPIER